MAKKKQSDLQSDFFEFVSTTHDPALEKEVYEDTGERIASDDHPALLKWRRHYFEWWVDNYPDGNLARMMRRLNSERKE